MKKIVLFLSILLCSNLFAQLPSNDNCNGAIQITPGTLNPTQGNAQNATQSYSPVTCGSYTSNQALDVFFKFTATQSSHVISIIPSSGYDPALFVYSGSCNGTLIGCSDAGGGNGQVEQVMLTGLNSGQTYYIKVYDYNNVGSPPSYTYTFDVYVASPTINGNASISFDPTNLSFGNVQVGYPASQLLTVSNNGTADLLVTNISYPSNFSGPSSIPVITVGNSYSLNVTFTPSSSGTHNGNITFTSNSNSSPDQVSVTGVGTNSPAPQISISTNSLSFGSVQVNTTSAPQQVTIYNTGQANLIVSSINMPSNYTSNYNGGTILPGNSVNVAVSFTPPSVGTFTGNMQIVNNATNKIITVTGGGTVGVPTNITGTVKDIEVSYGTSTVINNPINGATIQLKDANGNIVATTTTNSTGYFSLNAVSGLPPYHVIANYPDPSGNFVVGKTNVSTGSNLSILIPKTIISQINVLNDNLSHLTLQLPSINQSGPVYSYNTNSSQTLINDFRTFDNNFNSVMNNLTRLYLAERILLDYYNDANIMADELSKNIGAFSRIIGLLMASKTKLQHYSNPVLVYAVHIAGNSITTWVEDYISNSTSISDPHVSLIAGYVHYGFDALEGWINSEEPDQTNLVEAHANYLINTISGYIIKGYYITKTQSKLNNAVQWASDFNTTYNESNNNAIQNTKILIAIKEAHMYNTQSQMILSYGNASALWELSQLLTYSGTILAATGPGAAIAPAIVITGICIGGLSFFPLVSASENGFIELAYLRNSANYDIPNTAFRLNDYSDHNPVINPQENSIILSDAVANYNAALLDFSNDIDYSHENIAFQKLSDINNLNNQLILAIKNATNIIYSVAPILKDSIPGFKDTYNNQFVKVLMDNSALRTSFAFDILALDMDTTNYDTNTELVNRIGTLINSNNMLQITIAQFTSLCSGIRAKPYPMITDKVWNNYMEKNTSQIIKIKFKNCSNDTITDAYILTNPIGDFSISSDSVYIGSIMPLTEDSTLYTIISPNVDTTGGFIWQLISSNAYNIGTGGYFTTKEKNQTSVTYNKELKFNVMPNPSSENIDLEFHLNNKSEVIVRLLDINGKDIYSERKEYLPGDIKIRINTTKYPNGTYLLLLNNEGNEGATKILIQH